MSRKHHVFSTAALCLLAAAAAPSCAEPRITTIRTADGYKVVIDKFEGVDHDLAQAMIGSTVAQLCAGRSPVWGRFKLSSMMTPAPGKKLKPGRFEQLIKCVATQPAVETTPTPEFSATAANEKEVENTALAFLKLRDTGDAGGSFSMLAPSMQATTDRKNWDAEAAKRRAEFSSDVERRVVKVTWYVDPPGVEPGVYAAADFDGHSSKLAVHCGYVAFRRLDPKNWAVVRIDEGKLLAKDTKGLSGERIAELRASLQCRS